MDGEDNTAEESNSEEMLEQLRRWQQEQQRKLIEQQQQQRQLLLEKQKKLLSLINSGDVSNRSVENETEENPEDEDRSPSGGQQRLYAGVKSPQSVDNVPLKKPRAVKTFQQLLETSLNSKNEASQVQNMQQTKKSFTFLKRGQGISRFGVISKPKKVPIQKAPIFKNKQLNKENKAPAASLKKSTAISEKNKPTEEFPPKPTILPQQSSIESHTVPKTVEAVQKTQPSFGEIVRFQPSSFNNMEEVVEVNSSRNEEDLAVFELLERFATINASFSSSSSLIGQLMEKGVTHLPSPSKVISFLSKKRVEFHPEEEAASPNLQKTKTHRKHVHFAESLELASEDLDKPWLSGINNEESSPYVSNTVRPIRNPEQVNLDETPTSPIGFPDYQKLFGLPARSLWAAEERATSPTNEENPMKNLTDPSLDLKGLYNTFFSH